MRSIMESKYLLVIHLLIAIISFKTDERYVVGWILLWSVAPFTNMA